MSDSRLIILKRRIIEPNKELMLGSKVQGFYKLEAFNRRTGKKRLLADWFPNLITNAGLNFVGSSAGWAQYCKVGSGNAEPTVNDTAMQTFIASTNNDVDSTSSAQGSSPYYGQTSKTFRFAEGDAAGNIAEVGVGSATANGGTLWSRALILDGGSPTTPTTVTVLSDESLDVTYQLRMYPATESDVTSQVTISGVVYDVVTRPALVATSASWAPMDGTGGGSRGGIASCTAFSGSLGAVTSSPSGTSFSSTSNTGASYSNDTFYREATIVWGLTAGNNTGSPSGLQSFHGELAAASSTAGNWGSYQISVSPPIPKASTNILSLVFRHTWARR
jgi:hypothetical protein